MYKNGGFLKRCYKSEHKKTSKNKKVATVNAKSIPIARQFEIDFEGNEVKLMLRPPLRCEFYKIKAKRHLQATKRSFFPPSL